MKTIYNIIISIKYVVNYEKKSSSFEETIKLADRGKAEGFNSCENAARAIAIVLSNVQNVLASSEETNASTEELSATVQQIVMETEEMEKNI